MLSSEFPKRLLEICLMSILLLAISSSLATGAATEREEFISQMRKTAVFVISRAGQGTGTVVGLPIAKGSHRGLRLIVTARHLTESVDMISGKVTPVDTVTVKFPLKAGGIVDEGCTVAFRHPTLDWALLLPPATSLKADTLDILTMDLLSPASASEVHAGQDAFIVGFPFSIGFSNIRPNPVVQSGIIAYVDTVAALVLVDVQVNPGSSGSPVFVRTDVGTAKLLGVAFEYQPGNDWVLRINPRGNPYWANVNTGLARVVTLFELARYAQSH